MELDEDYHGYYIGYEANMNFGPDITITDDHGDYPMLEVEIISPSKIPIGTITYYENNYYLQDLYNKYRQYFEEFVIINQNSLKFQAVDRYFHYSVEVTRLLRKVEEQIKDEKDQRLLLKYFKNCTDYYQKVSALRAFSIFGLKNLEHYLTSRSSLIIDNPGILGLYYLTVDKETFQRIVYHDLLYSDLSLENRHIVFNRLISSIREAKERILLPFVNKSFISLLNSAVINNALKDINFNELIENYENEKKLKSIIHERLAVLENGISAQLKKSKILLTGKTTQSELIKIITAKIKKKQTDKGVNISQEKLCQTKLAVRAFVAKNTRNKGNRGIVLKKDEDTSVLYDHIDIIKFELNKVLKASENRNFDLNQLIKRNFPNFEISTIQNK